MPDRLNHSPKSSRSFRICNNCRARAAASQSAATATVPQTLPGARAGIFFASFGPLLGQRLGHHVGEALGERRRVGERLALGDPRLVQEKARRVA